jgi:hypothetical protein
MEWRVLSNVLGESPPGPLFPLARSNEGAPIEPVGARGLQQLLLSAPSAAAVGVEPRPGMGAVVGMVAEAARERSLRTSWGERRSFALAVPGALVPLLQGIRGVEWRVSALPHSLTELAAAEEVMRELAGLEGHPELAGAETQYLSTIQLANELAIAALRDGTIERERIEVHPSDSRFAFQLRVRHGHALVLVGGTVFLRDSAPGEEGLSLPGRLVSKAIEGWERDAKLRVSHGDLAVPLGAEGIFDVQDAQALAIELSPEELHELAVRLLGRWLTDKRHRGHRRRLGILLERGTRR